MIDNVFPRKRPHLLLTFYTIFPFFSPASAFRAVPVNDDVRSDTTSSIFVSPTLPSSVAVISNIGSDTWGGEGTVSGWS